MKIEEFDENRHWGLDNGKNKLVIHSGHKDIVVTEGQAYELCHDILDYLMERSGNS